MLSFLMAAAMSDVATSRVDADAKKKGFYIGLGANVTNHKANAADGFYKVRESLDKAMKELEKDATANAEAIEAAKKERAELEKLELSLITFGGNLIAGYYFLSQNGFTLGAELMVQLAYGKINPKDAKYTGDDAKMKSDMDEKAKAIQAIKEMSAFNVNVAPCLVGEYYFTDIISFHAKAGAKMSVTIFSDEAKADLKSSKSIAPFAALGLGFNITDAWKVQVGASMTFNGIGYDIAKEANNLLHSGREIEGYLNVTYKF